MEIKYYTGFKGVNKALTSRLIGDQYVSDCENVIFKKGVMGLRSGYRYLVSTPYTGSIYRMAYFEEYNNSYKQLIVCKGDVVLAYKDIYGTPEWGCINYSYINITDRVSISGSWATVSSTLEEWKNFIQVGDYVIFDTSDKTSPGEMYEITNLDLLNDKFGINGNVTYTDVYFILRRSMSVKDIAVVTDKTGNRGVVFVTESGNYYYDGSDTVSLISNSNPARTCFFLGAKTGHHLLTANVIDTGVEHPNTIEISNIGEPTNFSNGDYIDLYETSDDIKGIRRLRDALAVYKENSISLLTPSYSGNTIFNLRENVITGIGAININTVCTIGDVNVFVGNRNIYMFDGVNIKAIGDEVKEEVFSKMKDEAVENSFAIYNNIDNMYMLFICDGMSSICYVYDLDTGGWTKFKYAHQISAACYANMNLKVIWKEPYEQNELGTWDDLKDEYDSWNTFKEITNNPVLLFGDLDGNIYVYAKGRIADDDIPIRAYIETKDYSLNEPYKLVSAGSLLMFVKKHSVEGKRSKLKVEFSSNYGVGWTGAQYIYIDDDINTELLDKTVNFSIRGNYLRIKISNTEDGDNMQIDGYGIIFNNAGV